MSESNSQFCDTKVGPFSLQGQLCTFTASHTSTKKPSPAFFGSNTFFFRMTCLDTSVRFVNRDLAAQIKVCLSKELRISHTLTRVMGQYVRYLCPLSFQCSNRVISAIIANNCNTLTTIKSVSELGVRLRAFTGKLTSPGQCDRRMILQFRDCDLTHHWARCWLRFLDSPLLFTAQNRQQICW